MKDPTQDLFFKEQLVEEEKDLPLQQTDGGFLKKLMDLDL